MMFHWKNMKNVRAKENYLDSNGFPFSTQYSFESPDDHFALLSKSTLDCTDHHLVLQSRVSAGSPAPWMKKLDITTLENKHWEQAKEKRNNTNIKELLFFKYHQKNSTPA